MINTSENRQMQEETTDKSEDISDMSQDAQQRKLARCIRIQKRLYVENEHNDMEDEEIIVVTETEKQINESDELLEKLIIEGEEIVSNIRVANDARENQRREDFIAVRSNLLERLKKEAEISTKKYQEIEKQWSSILELNDPLDIYNEIELQKNERCTKLLAQKDVIIDELKKEIKNADEIFQQDQKQQSDEINLLIERIDTQINTISKAYRQELIFIEDTLKNERTNILKNITKEWNDLFEKGRNEEMKGVEKRREIMSDYEKQMDNVLTENQEQYKSRKKYLEIECQNLQQEVQNMKVLCMMNIEKLDYSYAVLKHREDENIIVKNQQKKRINKLYDTMNSLKKLHSDMKIKTDIKIEKIQEQVLKSQKNIQQLKAKSNYFIINNDKQFMQIWEMNKNIANDLVEEILNADKIIHEKILAINPEPCEEDIFKNDYFPLNHEPIKSEEKNTDNLEKLSNLKIISSQETKDQDKKLLNDMIKKISDKTSFLVEDKTNELLLSYGELNKIIIKLDIVFQSLNITSIDQINLLMEYFLPYTFCPTCDELINKPPTPEKSEESKILTKCHENLPARTKQLIDNVQKILPHQIENNQLVLMTDKNIEQVKNKEFNCSKDHVLEIETKHVIKALKEFIEKYHEDIKHEIPQDYKKQNTSKNISEKEINEYWKKYENIFTDEKIKLWDGLVDGLHMYRGILKERQKLINETESLYEQNLELCRLLDTYKDKPKTCGIKKAPTTADSQKS
ncbi:hypothetical protein HCN44_006135 [Aphidius gifuensis]|uniref:Dynein regulatory complex protein 1 n=1 Tax=Aphidius gifuensis TaxID=684658 RepID=A0A835CVS6_APHGI|nr:dynein regulatory complex protein 1 [Aphidius gifuensis]KAF7997564.1 hypothetical protein HCN44_006135 [Aphidius gifuensis]